MLTTLLIHFQLVLITLVTTRTFPTEAFTTPLPFSVPSSRRQSLSIPTAMQSTTENNSINEDASSSSSPTLPSVEELNQLLETAITASKKAGGIILSNMNGAEITKLKANPRDLLTKIDPLCEAVIKEIVLKDFPTHDFLGEEDVDPGKEASSLALENKLNQSGGGSSDYLWIVDPIDGTSNFVHGMPLCMPSIACAYKGETIIGVIYDPHRDELFTAAKNQGAKMNGEPISVGKQSTIGDAIIAMGSPPGVESMEMSLKAIQELMPKCRTIRMLGSAAIMLAWVANGRLTAYWEYDLSSWDIAAGALLITEAGGKFTDLKNVDYNLTTRKICGSNGLIQDELIDILNSAGVE